MRDEIEAHKLANFKHLAYGHMAKEISWHLPTDIFDDLPKQNVSTINVETIQKDFERCLHTTTKIFEQLGEKKATAIPKTKHNYQQWYKPGTFNSAKQFSDIKRLFHDRYLSDDHSIHDKLNGI